MDAVIAARRIEGDGTPAAAWRGDPQLQAVLPLSSDRLLAACARGALRSVELRHYRIRSAFLPFNTHIAGTAIA